MPRDLPAQAKPAITDSRHFWLDACRSIAIIMVLFSHGRHFLTPTWEWAAVFRIGGFLGVELFFVLSGFLIGSIAWHSFKHASLGKPWVKWFLMRRWLRTLPNYYLFLGVNALLIVYAIAPGRVGDLLPFMAFMQNLAWPSPSVFGEAWSLAVEEIFYLILPLSLFFLGKWVPDKSRVFVMVTALLLLIPLLARAVTVEVSEPLWDAGIRKVVVFRLDALMIGVLTSWLVHEYCMLNKVRGIYIITAAMVVLSLALSVFIFAEKTIDSNVFARVWLFPMVSIGCMLAVLSGLSWGRRPFMLGRTAEVCARWSYALYLSHMPVFHLIVWWLGFTQPGDISGALARWGLFISGSVCVAALVERFFERPILHWRERTVPR